MRDKNPVIMGLIGALLLSTPAVAATADDFTDFPSDWSAPALSQAVENGLLNGYDGKINPTGLLTRAQMATMVNRAFGATATASLSGYEDVAPTDWYYEELAKAVQMGTFQGDNGALRPNQPITREQAFAVLARAFVLEAEDTDALNTFPDKGEVSSWAANAVAALVENGYVTGSNGKLNPKSQITRAEFAQVISNLAGTYVDQSGPAARMVAGNVIVRGDAVSLHHLTVHGDLILADGAANVSLDNVRVTGRIVIRGGGEGVQLTHRHVHQSSHLVNEGPGAPGAGAVHPLLQGAAEEDDLGVLAAQLNDGIRLGDVCIDRRGGGVDLLHKIDAGGVGHAQTGRAGDDQFHLFARQQTGDGMEGLAGPFPGLGVVPLVGAEQQFVLFVQHHHLDGGGADVDADAQTHSDL